MNLHASVVLTIHGEPLAFPIPRSHPAWNDLNTPSGSDPGSLEGIWLEPRPGRKMTFWFSATGLTK